MPHCLSVISWYNIPGLAELPLGNGVLLFLAGPFQRFSVFSICPGTFCFFFFLFPFFFSRACVLWARHHGRDRRRRGCQRGRSGKAGIETSAVAVLCLGVVCASRHEGSMKWLCLASMCMIPLSMYMPLRFIRHCKGKGQTVLIFATGVKFTDRFTQSEHQHCRAGEREPR